MAPGDRAPLFQTPGGEVWSDGIAVVVDGGRACARRHGDTYSGTLVAGSRAAPCEPAASEMAPHRLLRPRRRRSSLLRGRPGRLPPSSTSRRRAPVPGKALSLVRRDQRRRQRGHRRPALLHGARARPTTPYVNMAFTGVSYCGTDAGAAGEDEGDRVLRAGGRRCSTSPQRTSTFRLARPAGGRLRVPAPREGPARARGHPGLRHERASRGRSLDDGFDRDRRHLRPGRAVGGAGPTAALAPLGT
ncbi:MAG: hypothetical protein MZW92_56405 [Comamonadaceae bacterium]|nr:hypothetical protein [Comamonadaceae bacterium]